MTLAQAIKTYCSSTLPCSEIEAPALRWDLLDECRKSISKRLEESKEIKAISEETLPLLEEIRDHIDDQSRVNRNIARIDQMRARMDTLGRTYEQVSQFTQESELQKFKQDRKLAALRLTGLDKQKHQVERDIDNIRAVITAAASFRDLMAEVCDRLQQQKEAA
jgi:methyl-accepting chemotaxis protein